MDLTRVTAIDHGELLCNAIAVFILVAERYVFEAPCREPPNLVVAHFTPSSTQNVLSCGNRCPISRLLMKYSLCDAICARPRGGAPFPHGARPGPRAKSSCEPLLLATHPNAGLFSARIACAPRQLVICSCISCTPDGGHPLLCRDANKSY